MGIEIAVGLLEEVFFNTEFSGQTWLIYLFIIFGTLVLITRIWKDWGILALPVMVGWRYFGIPIPYVFFSVATLIFVVSVLSVPVISSSLSGLGNVFMIGRAKSESLKRGIDFKRKMDSYSYELLKPKAEKGKLTAKTAEEFAWAEKAKEKAREKARIKFLEWELKKKKIGEKLLKGRSTRIKHEE